MPNPRLILIPKRLHFFQWEKEEFSKYFEIKETNKVEEIASTDILLVHTWPEMCKWQDVICRAKFGMLYPGYGFQPWLRLKLVRQARRVCQKYQSVFANEGPVYERLRGSVHLVPFSANQKEYTKTRSRIKFKTIIQVARNEFYKGRHIAEAAMKLMPYEWSLYPSFGAPENYLIPHQELKYLYQSADGFLSPNMIGPPPRPMVDAKYTQATMEAGLSGCIIFWHDCMSLGNSFETVFPISLDPKEIAQKIQDTINTIDLDKHSTLTAQEFYEKCNAESAVRAKIEIMRRFL